jgi:type VI secretion system protein ImpC
MKGSIPAIFEFQRQKFYRALCLIALPTLSREHAPMSGSGRVGFDFTFAMGKPPTLRVQGSKLRMLVVADFAGTALPSFSIKQVNLDNLDALLKAFSPQIQVQSADPSVAPCSLSFESLDDFHPDEIFKRVSWFSDLDRTRRELSNPATFASAAARLLGTGSAAPSSATEPAAATSLFASLLGGNAAPAATTAKAPPAAGLDAMIARAIAPHVVPNADPQLGQLMSAVEATMADRMRDILHSPSFARLESAWRGLERLVATFPGDAGVDVWVAAVPPIELLEDATKTDGQLDSSLIAELLCSASAPAWSIVVVDHLFGKGPDDLMGLGAFGAAAGKIGASIVAGAAPSLAGQRESTIAETWSLLRQSPLAPHLSLVYPSMLLRLPYGPRRNEVRVFPFDELGSNGEPNPQRLLWGAGSWAVAGALAKAFTEDPNDLPLGASDVVDDMPTLTYRNRDGETQLYPCAQLWLNEASAQSVLAAGLIPLVAHKDLARATLLRMQSIASPPQPMLLRSVES